MTKHDSRLLQGALAVLATAMLSSPALAIDAAWSGFATLGYARSNSDYTYQRFINRDGTWKRDSLAAGQLDLRLSQQWSVTVQAKAAIADNHDDEWRIEPSWAFVAWRPDNDWLVRAGKLRVPLYLYSESLDVGISHDMARLPHEVYSVSPTNEFTGLFVTRGLNVGTHELTIDVYAGSAQTQARTWTRDGLPPMVKPGAHFPGFDVKLGGVALTVREPDVTWRIGLLANRLSKSNGSSVRVRFPRVDLAPGIGYWQVDDALPGPGIEKVNRLRTVILTAGVDWQIGDGWRLTSELAAIRRFDTELGLESVGGYAALFKRIDNFTPYISVARLKSSSVVMGWAKRLLVPGLPAQIPGAAQINAAQRLAGESGYAYDQESVALGLSYELSPTMKLKGEWMRIRVGELSNNFDVPAGKPDTQGLRVNTLSVNFSVAF